MKKTFVILLAVSLLLVMTFSGCFAEKTEFSDINGHYAEKTINKWIGKGVISGYPDGTFKPDKFVTRAELAALITNAFQLQEKSMINYDDIDSSAWYYPYIERAVKYIPMYSLPVEYESNIPYVESIERGENEFLPEVDTLRTHVAETLSEIKIERENLNIEIPPIDEVQASLLETFNDNDYEELFNMVSGVPNNVKRMFNYAWLANELDIMHGDTDGYFRPYGRMTRAELLIAIDRILTE